MSPVHTFRKLSFAFSVLLVFSFLSQPAFSQTSFGSLKGTVLTSDGELAAGVTVRLRGTSRTIITDDAGQFVFPRMNAGNHELEISFVGYETLHQQLSIEAGKETTVSLSLRLSGEQLQEVIVKGQTGRINPVRSDQVARIPLKNLENPQVYTTISRQLITEQQLFTADDAMRNATGVQKMWEGTGRSGDGGSYYSSRGFIMQAKLRNGLAGVVSSTIDAANLERIEVIKGPSATLFGSTLTSYGGLINRVTKKPYDRLGGEVNYSLGQYDFNRFSADINTPIDQKKQWLFRLNGALSTENSFQDQGYAKTGAIAPSLQYKPNDKLTVNLDAELYYGKSIGKQIYFFYFPAAALGATRADQLPVDYKKSYMGEGLTQRTRSANYYAQVNYKMSKSFTSSTNFTLSNSYSNGFGPYFYFVPDDVATGDPAQAGKSNYITRADQSTRNSRSQLFGVQQNFNGDFMIGKMRNRIVAGLDYLRLNSKQEFFGSVFDVVPVNDKDYDYTAFNGNALNNLYANNAPDFVYPIRYISNTYSAYALDVLSLTKNLQVLAGLRLDYFDNKGGSQGGAVPAYNQAALSPKFGIVYQPLADRVSIFANYQNSFNNKGAYTAYDPQDADSLVQLMAKPEQANQTEAGVKLDMLGGRLSATVSYYYIVVKNMLRTNPDPEAASRFAQLQNGEQRSKGVEVEITGNPVRGLTIVTGFSYNDSKMQKADADVNGRRPTTASSPVNANIWAGYRFLDGSLKGLGFGVGANYSSDNKVMNSQSMGVFILPSYTVLNASAYYQWEKFRLGVRADNFTNQKYWIGYTTMNPQKLRQVVGTLSYRF